MSRQIAIVVDVPDDIDLKHFDVSTFDACVLSNNVTTEELIILKQITRKLLEQSEGD